MNQAKHLTIMQMNDTHGYYDLHPEMFIEQGEEQYRKAGGYARIATIFNEVREENPNGILTLDNGDTFHGTYPVIESKGEALISVVNALQFDAMTAHWEFAYGPEQFHKLAKMLDYPMLACNCYREGTEELVFPSHLVVERAGLKIGVIGIAEHIVDKMMPPHFSEGIYFTLGNKEIPGIIKQLREEEQVDLVIVLSHFGFPQEVELAKETEGIDILLSGHTHNSLSEPVVVNNTIIIQSGCHGAHVGRLDIEVKDRTIVSCSHRLIEVSEETKPDYKVQKMIEKAIEPSREMLEQVIGETNTDLHRYSQLESTMDNLLLQSLLDVSGAELAFSNGWRYGAPVPAGPITMNDIWNIIPTNPPVSMVDITGKEIIDLLEENLEHTFSSNPYNQMGGYVKRCLGMKMYVKIENPQGLRIQDLFIGGKSVDKRRSYSVAFVTVQGVPEKYGKNRRNLDINAVDALKQYIKETGTVSAGLRGTIQVI